MCTKKYLFCFKNHLLRLQFSVRRHFLLDVFQEVRVGPIKSKLRYMASTCCCDLLSQLNSPISLQLKTTWYFNQQVSKPNMARLTSKGFCSFPLRLKIREFFVEKKLCFVSFNTVHRSLSCEQSYKKHTKLNHNHPNCFTNDTLN